MDDGCVFRVQWEPFGTGVPKRVEDIARGSRLSDVMPLPPWMCHGPTHQLRYTLLHIFLLSFVSVTNQVYYTTDADINDDNELQVRVRAVGLPSVYNTQSLYSQEATSFAMLLHGNRSPFDHSLMLDAN